MVIQRVVIVLDVVFVITTMVYVNASQDTSETDANTKLFLVRTRHNELYFDNENHCV